MPLSDIWPFDVPFQMEPIRTWKKGGAQLEYYQFHSETGTRLSTKAKYHADAPGIGAVNFGELVDRETVVVDIPKEADEEIRANEIDQHVASRSDYRAGDALLIRTGWGSQARLRQFGVDYVLRSPRLAPDAVARLCGVLRDKGSNLLAIDTPCLAAHAGAHLRREWVSLPPWQRPHWPSDAARTYLRHYGPDKAREDWGADLPLYEQAQVLLALCDAGAITTRKVLLTALPLFAQDMASAPTTVIVKPGGPVAPAHTGGEQ